MTSEDEWTWAFAPQASDQFESLDAHVQDRIVSKLDEIVDSQWRDPDDFLEPRPAGRSRSFEWGSIASPAS